MRKILELKNENENTTYQNLQAAGEEGLRGQLISLTTCIGKEERNQLLPFPSY